MALYSLRDRKKFLISKFVEFSVWALVAAGLIASRANMQPELFGLIFFIAFFCLRDALLAQRRFAPAFFYVALFAIWANLHASFIYAIVLLGLQALSRLFLAVNLWTKGKTPRDCFEEYGTGLSHLICLAGIAFFSALITPYGFDLYRFIFSVVKDMPVIERAIIEWQPTEMEPKTLFFWLYYGFGLFAIARASWAKRALEAEATIVWVACGLMAFSHVRHIAIFGVATLPYLARMLSDLRTSSNFFFPSFLRERGRGEGYPLRLLSGIGLIALGLFSGSRHFERAHRAVFLFRNAADKERSYIAQNFPRKAFDFLERNPDLLALRTYTEWGWGGYAQWRAGLKGLRIFWDGRYLFHDLLKDALQRAYSEKQWSQFLQVWGIDLIVRSLPRNSEYRPYAQKLPNGQFSRLLKTKAAVFYPKDEWALIWWDEASIVLARRNAVSPSFLKKQEYQFWIPIDFYDVVFKLKQGSMNPGRLVQEMMRNREEAGKNFLNEFFLNMAQPLPSK
ncbi:MAG: hypothetical protein AAB091_01800 [Elusimicrobiota bacterium]